MILGLRWCWGPILRLKGLGEGDILLWERLLEWLNRYLSISICN